MTREVSYVFVICLRYKASLMVIENNDNAFAATLLPIWLRIDEFATGVHSVGSLGCAERDRRMEILTEFECAVC